MERPTRFKHIDYKITTYYKIKLNASYVLHDFNFKTPLSYGSSVVLRNILTKLPKHFKINTLRFHDQRGLIEIPDIPTTFTGVDKNASANDLIQYSKYDTTIEKYFLIQLKNKNSVLFDENFIYPLRIGKYFCYSKQLDAYMKMWVNNMIDGFLHKNQNTTVYCLTQTDTSLELNKQFTSLLNSHKIKDDLTSM